MSTIKVNTLQTAGGLSPVPVSDIAKTSGLASSSGASLVGHMPDEFGAVSTTVEKSLNIRKSIYAFMSATQQANAAARDTAEDLTSLFQLAANTGREYYLPDGAYKVSGVVAMPAGAAFVGSRRLSDNESKHTAGSTSATAVGAVFVLGAGSKFVVAANSAVENVTAYYPTQNYNITVDGGKPDGLADFVVFPPTFEINAGYGSPTIKSILYIGGTTIVYSPVGSNCEKLMVEDIRGCCTGIAFDIRKSYDVLTFKDIHLNPNSVYREIPGLPFGAEFTRFATKLAKNFDVFNFADNDGVNLVNVFNYACRNYINASGSGAGITGVNCAADVCHTFLNLSGNGKSFGIHFTNTWATPIVYSPVIDGSVSTETPALVRFNSVCTGQTVLLSNVRTSGNTVGFVAGSGKVVNVFQASDLDTCDNNRLFITNSSHQNVLGGLCKNISPIFRQGSVLNWATTKNSYVDNVLWGEAENMLVDGWGDQQGALWKRAADVTLNAGATNGAIGGLQVTSMPTTRTLSLIATYVKRSTQNHSIYIGATNGSKATLENILVTIDELDTAGTLVATLYSASLWVAGKDTNIKTGVAADSAKLLRITLTNNNAGTVSFGFASGFATAAAFPKVAPSSYGDIPGGYVGPNDSDYTTRRGKNITVFYFGALTAVRTVNLNILNPAIGDIVTVTRNSTATGASALEVKESASLRVSLASGQWATLMYSGTSWGMVSKGTI